jgi:hypothetical protein
MEIKRQDILTFSWPQRADKHHILFVSFCGQSLHHHCIGVHDNIDMSVLLQTLSARTFFSTLKMKGGKKVYTVKL